MQPGAAEFARAYGGQFEKFVALQLAARDLMNADLILTLTVEQRTRVLQLAPSQLKETFTLRELGRMSDYRTKRSESGTQDWRELAHLAASVRHLKLAYSPLEDDVVDPYLKEEHVYWQMEDQMISAPNSLADFLGQAQT